MSNFFIKENEREIMKGIKDKILMSLLSQHILASLNPIRV
jgi:hypothetical protein